MNVEVVSPVVSVLMRVHNGERFLAQAIRSILGQTFRDLELIILDDGSTDTTATIAESFRRADARVVLHRDERRGGVAVALNRAASTARGEFLAVMDADDVALPRRIETQVRFLREHPSVCLVGSSISVIDEAANHICTLRYPVNSARIDQARAYSNPIATSTAMFRRSVFNAVGGCRSVLLYSEDYDLWLRMGEVSETTNVGEILVLYRIHKAQQSNADFQTQLHLVGWTQASALARHEGRPDPLARSDLTMDQLSDQKLPDAVLRRALPEECAARAHFFVQVGAPVAALRIMDAGMAIFSAEDPEPRARTRLHVARARAHVSLHAWPSVARDLMSALLSDPREVIRSVRQAVHHTARRYAD